MMFDETVGNLKQAIVVLRAREVEHIEEKAKLQQRINDLERALCEARAKN
jgi:hypothetical protein